MLEFRRPLVTDRQWIQPLLAHYADVGSEGAFGTLFIWSEIQGNLICHKENTLFWRFGVEVPTYYFPLGEMELVNSLQLLMDDAVEAGRKFRMWGLTEGQKEKMEQAMPGKFEFKLDRPGSDYIYSTEKMIDLAGRKLHRKRNHLNRFRRTYSYVYEELTSGNIPECMAMAWHWLGTNGEDADPTVGRETCALFRAFANFDALNLRGGLIRIEGKVVAFTLGEAINDRVFLIHFEKALSEFDGLYAAINQEFAAHELTGYELVNREEDMGIEGLRKAKLSYYPELILEKYSATLKEEV